jgi:Trm5-related predicted tRNA methylase
MPTAIITTQAERSTKERMMHNLAGQVVDKTYKGIVIMNGKKFMNK